MALLRPVPRPYQPGSVNRACVHANTHGIARSEWMPPFDLRADDGGLRRTSGSIDRRRHAEVLVEIRGIVDERAVRIAAFARNHVHHLVPLRLVVAAVPRHCRGERE